jgi:hypothetical protein
LNVIFTLKTRDAPPDRDRTAGISKRYRNLELSDGRIVLRSFDLDNPSGMKGQMPRIEGEIQPVAIGIRGKNRVQILAERGDLFPVSADNVSDCIPSFQKKTEDGFAPESRRVRHGEAGHIIPEDKSFFIRHPLTNKIFVQTAQNRFLRPFELILSSAEEKTIRAKPLFMSVTEPDARIRGIIPPADFAWGQHGSGLLGGV